ncbi:hypothetical protein [Neobacillus mesonae]|uniref:hypothetical protein n=1 Tax=Neobacillus mesonae TaxID=1193713 RepID=UPI002E22FECC|nr:hypothetical protein [Neobacillus mesonae]
MKKKKPAAKLYKQKQKQKLKNKNRHNQKTPKPLLTDYSSLMKSMPSGTLKEWRKIRDSLPNGYSIPDPDFLKHLRAFSPPR